MAASFSLRRSLRALAMMLVAAVAGSGALEGNVAQAQGARIWLNNSADYLRRGDRLDIRFSVPDDSYVAIVHIDPAGELDFLFPSSPSRSEFVRAGRVHSLAGLGSASRVARGGDGIGYLYIIASPYRLDFSYFRGPGAGWSWASAGRLVHGDPFLAFDQVTRLIVPRWPTAVFAADYFSYYVGGYRAFPVYACSDRSRGHGWGWTPMYGSCQQQNRFLTRYPHYYDTRRYGGDRRAVLRQYEHLYPAHRYKEPAGSWVREVPTRSAPADERRGRDFVPADGSRGGADRSAPPADRASERGRSRDVGRPATSGGGEGRARPAPDAGRATGGSARPATSGPAAAGARGAPTTNRGAGRGATSGAAQPATSRGRP